MAGRSTVENVDITLTATDKASKPIDDVAQKTDALTDADVVIKGDDQASDDLAHVQKEADATDKKKPVVAIHSEGADSVLKDLQDIQTRADGVVTKTGAIGPAAGGAGAAVQSAAGKMSDALGNIPGPIGDIASSFGGITTAVGAVGGVVALFWKSFNDQADAAKKKLEEVKGAQLSMAGGDISKATELLTQQYNDHAKALEGAGISQQQYADIITKNIPLTNEQKDALAQNGNILGLTSKAIEDNRKQWASVNDKLVESQTSQFNMAVAIGATNDQLLHMAGTALPSVQAQILAYVGQVNGIPDSKMTEIMTDANPDDVKQVQDELDNLAKDRDSTVNVDADLSAARAKLQAFQSEIARQTHVIPTASAGPSSAVPVGVGVGAQSSSGTAPAAYASARAGGVFNSYTINVTVPVGAPTADIGRYVADALDAHERRSGSRRRVA
jgi:hypothetical protein